LKLKSINVPHFKERFIQKNDLVLPRIVVRKVKRNLFFTIVSAYDHVIASISCGKAGFKGRKKMTNMGAQAVGRMTALILMKKQIRFCDLIIRSYYDRMVRYGFKSLRRFGTRFFKFRQIMEVIKKGHNGLRKRKKRSV